MLMNAWFDTVLALVLVPRIVSIQLNPSHNWRVKLEAMVVIQQVYDKLAIHPKPQLHSQCNPNRGDEETLIPNLKRSPAGVLCAVAKKAGQGEDRKHKHVIIKARDEIKDKSYNGDGSCCSLRHDGHFAPLAVRPKLVMKPKKKSKDVAVDGNNTVRCGCCRHASSVVGKESSSKSPCVGDGDGEIGDVREGDKGGLRCKSKGAAEVRLRDQAEWFNSSFNLLTIEPRTWESILSWFIDFPGFRV